MKTQSPLNILIIDDDATYRNSMRRLFWTIKDGFPSSILEASGGQEALEALRQEQVDCLLLDHRMPGGDGIFWINKFLEINPCLPIVMVTGQGDEPTAVKAMKQGALDYLVKGSISVEALQRAIINAVQKMALHRKMEEQQKALLQAERNRGIIESLSAACNRLGQPMTVITMCLDMIGKKEWSPEERNMINQCNNSVIAVNEILQQLQQVGFFQNKPYLNNVDEGNDWFDEWLSSLSPEKEEVTEGRADTETEEELQDDIGKQEENP